MALTIHGYRLEKAKLTNVHHIKGCLTVKPYVPAVFKNPKFVTRYAVYKESDDYLYIPKHYGIDTYGSYATSTRDVTQTDDTFWEFGGLLRDIQYEVINSFLKPEPHDGILSLQTGGGKTVCALYIASQLKLPTMVLVNNTFLKDQWVERIQKFLPKARIGFVQGDVIEIENKDIVVAMLQSLALKEYPINTFKPIGLVIVDECHHIASEAFSQSIPKITSKYMLGLSATPERKDGLMHVINWFLGPILYKSDTSDKIDEKVNVEFYEYDPKDPVFSKVIYNDAGVMFTSLMINKLVEYEARNRFLVDILSDVYEEKHRNILVLSDRVEHCEKLFNLLDPKIQDVSCILSRGTNSKTRDEWYIHKRIFIATYHMCKEAFDLEKLNTLMISTPRPDVDQIVGRIMRTEKSKRTIHPLIIDVVDVTFRRQFQERLSLYKKRNYNVQKMEI